MRTGRGYINLLGEHLTQSRHLQTQVTFPTIRIRALGCNHKPQNDLASLMPPPQFLQRSPSFWESTGSTPNSKHNRELIYWRSWTVKLKPIRCAKLKHKGISLLEQWRPVKRRLQLYNPLLFTVRHLAGIFFNRKDKLLSKCNNCFNDVPLTTQEVKKRNWKIGILLLHDQLIVASNPGSTCTSEEMQLFGDLTAIQEAERLPNVSK